VSFTAFGGEAVVAEQVTLVRFEPCLFYADGDVADSPPACWHCGWLEQDHLAQVDAPFAVAGWAPHAQRLAS
jgi:hypothetical protein